MSSIGGGGSGRAKLCIRATSDAALRKATELCEAHLQSIANDLVRWSAKQSRSEPTTPRRPSQGSGGGSGGGGGSRKSVDRSSSGTIILPLSAFIVPAKPKHKG